MTGLAFPSIAPVSGSAPADVAHTLDRSPVLQPAAQGDGMGTSFQSILSAGLDTVNRKVAEADTLVRQFAVDDSVAVHRVTIALEEARLSVEFAMQVRARLAEAYRDLMTMQL